MSSKTLSGRCVLIVEDDYFVANDCANTLREHGAEILGPVPDVARARALAAARNPHCVLLDIHLKGALSFDFAAELVRRGIPTVFATGYDAAIIPTALQRLPSLQKPFESHELLRVVSHALMT